MFGYPLHLDATCMFGHPMYVWMSLYLWTPPVCLDNVWMPPYVWMAHACLNAPICVDTLLYVSMPLCLDATCMFGHLLYLWMAQYVWTPPVCLDNVWMPPYIHNTKKACFVRLRECPYAAIHLDAPCMFGCPISLDGPLYV